MGLLEQTSPLARAPAGVERDLVAVESRPSLGSLQEEEEDEDKEVCWFYSHYVEEDISFSSVLPVQPRRKACVRTP